MTGEYSPAWCSALTDNDVDGDALWRESSTLAQIAREQQQQKTAGGVA